MDTWQGHTSLKLTVLYNVACTTLTDVTISSRYCALPWPTAVVILQSNAKNMKV